MLKPLLAHALLGGAAAFLAPWSPTVPRASVRLQETVGADVESSPEAKKYVVVGGGWGGWGAAKALCER